jgi:hypothetical protein
MSLRHLGAALAALVFLLFPVSAFADNTCFPKCREGFVCNLEGKCVSECNPPCDDGDACRAGACIPREGNRKGQKRTAVSTESTEGASTDDASPSEPKTVELAWTGGIGVHATTVTAPVLRTSFLVAVGGRHAFFGGISGGIAFFDNFAGGTGTVGEAALDLGYRGYFTTGTVNAGMFVAFEPQIWAGSGDALAGLGAAVGGVLTYGRLFVEVPISVVRVAPFEHHFDSGNSAVVVTPSVAVGLVF